MLTSGYVWLRVVECGYGCLQVVTGVTESYGWEGRQWHQDFLSIELNDPLI